MQEKPPQARLAQALIKFRVTVFPVTSRWMTDIRPVHPDLVRPARFQVHLRQGSR